MTTVDVKTGLPSIALGQPDIGYAPNYDKYLARTKKRLEVENLKKSLPPDFPSKLSSDLVWSGTDIENETDWLYQLSLDDIQEIEHGLEHFKGENIVIVCTTNSLTTNSFWRSSGKAFRIHQPRDISTTEPSYKTSRDFKRDTS
jgi:hypothetical protein